MAFNITVQSLLSSALYDTYSVETTTTVGTLTTAIQSATGVEPTWYVLNYNDTLLTNSSATLGSYGITGTVALRSGNKIGRLTTLEDRQKAKLDLAALDRTASGNPRDTYDITELPTQYSGNVVVDNPNPGGLIEGRPWITAPLFAARYIIPTVAAVDTSSFTLDTGVWKRKYNGYFGDGIDRPGQTPAYKLSKDAEKFATYNINSRTPTTQEADSILNDYYYSSQRDNNKTLLVKGYFLAPDTGDYTIYVESDDASYMWLGPDATVTNLDLSAATVQNPGYHGPIEESGVFTMLAGEYYALTILMGNGPVGNGMLEVSYSSDTIAKTNNFTGRLFYNTATNGH